MSLDDQTRNNPTEKTLVTDEGQRAAGVTATITATPDMDTIEGTSAADTIAGGGDEDWLRGMGGDDLLLGEDGDDYMQGFDGNDTLDGGIGYDQVTYHEDPAGVWVSLLTGTATDGYGDTDTLLSIEMIRGSAYNDTLTGDAGNNVIRGLAGNDTLEGGAGNDQVRYDRDASYGGTSGVFVDLAAGYANDGFGNTDQLSGFERVRGSDFSDLLQGDAGDNELDGRDGGDGLFGMEGNDTLIGGGGRDWLAGGAGNDLMTGGDGDDLFEVGQGNDTITDFNVVYDMIDNANITDEAGFLNMLATATDVTYEGAPAAMVTDSTGATATFAGYDSGGLVEALQLMVSPRLANFGGIDFFDAMAALFDVPAPAIDTSMLPHEFWVGGTFNGAPVTFSVWGSNLAFDVDGNLSGTIDFAEIWYNGAPAWILNSVAIDGAQFQAALESALEYIGSNGTSGSLDPFYALLDPYDMFVTHHGASEITNSGAGDDFFIGGDGEDSFGGGDGDDTMDGGAGDDELAGEGGNDSLIGGEGAELFFVGDGNDTIADFEGFEVEGIVGGFNTSDDVSTALANATESLVDGVYQTTVTLTSGGTLTFEGWTQAGLLQNFQDAYSGPTPGNGLPTLIINEYSDEDFFEVLDRIFVSADGPTTDTVVDSTSVTMEATFGGVPYMINWKGTGLGINGDDDLTGTLEEVELYSNGVLVFWASGFSEDAQSFTDALEQALEFELSGGTTGDDGPFNDIIDRYNVDYLAYSAAGDVEFGAGNGDDTVNTVEGNDIIETFGGNDSINAGAGDDEIEAGDGDDTVNGGDGDDYFVSGAGDDDYNGGDGIDQVTYQRAPGGVTVDLDAGTGSDGEGGTDTLTSIEMLRGSLFADDFTGSAGDEQMRGLDGDDTMDGGDGWDVLRYDRDARYGGTAGVMVDLANGTATDGFGGTDVISNFEEVRGSESADLLIGDANDNELRGDMGDDTLDGGDGDDTLEGAAGADMFVVGYGNNVISDFEGFATDEIVTSNGDDLAALIADASEGLFDGVTSTILYPTTGGSITIVGWALSALQSDYAANGGGAGGTGGVLDVDAYTSVNLLVLVDGILNSGDNPTPAVTVNTPTQVTFSNTVGGTAYELTFVGTGLSVDPVSGTVSGTLTAVNVTSGGTPLYTASGLNEDANAFQYAFVEAIRFEQSGGAMGSYAPLDAIFADYDIDFNANGNAQDFGSGAGDDTLVGGSGNDEFFGADGMDSIDGGDDDDLLEGEGGIDFIDGGAGNDTISGGEDGDSIVAGAGDDVVQGDAGTDTINGNDGSDTLNGGEGDDSVMGDAGADVLISGNSGTDTLNGGADADTFVIQAGSGNVVIEDMVFGTDSFFTEAESPADIQSAIDNAIDDTVDGSPAARITLPNGGQFVYFVGFTATTLQASYAAASTPQALVVDAYTDQPIFTLMDEVLTGGTSGLTVTTAPGQTELSLLATVGGVPVEITMVGIGLSYDAVAGSFSGVMTGLTVEQDGVLLWELSGANEAAADFGTIISDMALWEASNGTLGSTASLQALLDKYNVQFTGDDKDQMFWSGVGADTLTGGGGNDSLEGGDGDDSIDGDGHLIGGNGDDTISGNGYLDGGNGDDAIYGEDGDDTILGGNDNDTIVAGAGGDWIEGGDGDDQINGYPGDDTILDGAGDDTLLGGDGDDLFVLGTGNDRFDGRDGEDTLSINLDDFTFPPGYQVETNLTSGYSGPLGGGALSDTVAGIEHVIYSGLGADVSITGTGGANLLIGAEGDDTINGLGGNDTLEGGFGNDRITGGDGNDFLWASGGDDLLESGEGNDSLYGGDGNDTLDVSGGNNFLKGDGGNDSIDASTNFTGTDTLFGGTGDDTLLAGAGDDLLNGEAGNDSLNGGTGDNTLLGGDGSDTLIGGQGNDMLIGMSENDSIIGYGGNDTLNGGTGDDTLDGSISFGTQSFYGGDGADSIIGGSGNDTAYGGAGDDTISAFNGQNLFFGDAGFDSITGGLQDDRIFGGTDGDTIDGGAGNDMLLGEDGNDSVIGGGGNDGLYGMSGDDTLYGDYGNDIISGGIGDDLIFDLGGLDTILGGDGNDTVSAGGNEANFIYLGTGNDTGGGGKGIDTIAGEAGHDDLYGDDGDDRLYGGSGNDTLQGDAGQDWLNGGTGADDFVFTSTTDGFDVVLDFRTTDGDELDFTALTGGLGLTETQLLADGYIYSAAGGGGASTSVYLDLDGSAGAGAGVLIAYLSGVAYTPGDLDEGWFIG